MTPRRRMKCEELCPDAMEHYDRIEDSGPQPQSVIDADRAGGYAECDSCGNILHDHPNHPFDSCLTILCDGSIVKL